MADQFYLDRPGVEHTAAGVRATQQRLSTALGSLRSVLTRRDGCWGTDDIGKGFGDKYKPGETDALQYADDMVTGFQNYADGLVNYADQFSQVDQDNATELDRLDAEQIREEQREQEEKAKQQQQQQQGGGA